jgi:hypothetical protein
MAKVTAGPNTQADVAVLDSALFAVLHRRSEDLHAKWQAVRCLALPRRPG